MHYCAAILLSVGLLLVPKYVFPCSCTGPPGVEESLETATEVFSGTVVEIKPIQFEYFGDISQLEIRVDVKACWKGSCKDTLSVATLGDSGSCGIQFHVGQEYLIYAYLEVETGMSWVWECGRTNTIAGADEDLRYLGDPIFVRTAPPSL